MRKLITVVRSAELAQQRREQAIAEAKLNRQLNTIAVVGVALIIIISALSGGISN